MNDILQKIADFEKKHANIRISYGGDGTVLSIVERIKTRQSIIPFRNYGLCNKHSSRLDDFLNGKENQSDLKLTRCPFIEYKITSSSEDVNTDRGIAEVVFKQANMTEALRFNVYVNGKTYLSNVIADGALICTRYASTGYFKSITRMIFSSDSLGIGFIAPTQGISNLIVKDSDVLRFEFLRDALVNICVDKKQCQHNFVKGESIEVRQLPDAISIFGLAEFHCYECRKNRHSIVEAGVPIQDQYMII